MLASLARPCHGRTAGSRRPWLSRNLVQMPPGFEFEDCDKIRRVNQRFVLGAFGSVEITFVRPLAEHLDPSLHRWIDTEGSETSSRFRVEAAAQRFQEAVKPGCHSHVLTVTETNRAGKSCPGRGALRWPQVSFRWRRLVSQANGPDVAEIGQQAGRQIRFSRTLAVQEPSARSGLVRASHALSALISPLNRNAHPCG